jgi:putative phosphoribosyl transferase
MHKHAPPEVVSPVAIALDAALLQGELALPTQPKGVVLFAHGSGSSRHSPRNTYATRFDIPLLTSRLVAATRWILRETPVTALPIGYFGASTGAAAALAAAAEMGTRIGAVVSRGGRPDLAGAAALQRVTAPTLLIVGGNDTSVIALNREAWAQLGCVKMLHIVPGATHLFEEPGTLEQAATVASDWLARWLTARGPTRNS